MSHPPDAVVFGIAIITQRGFMPGDLDLLQGIWTVATLEFEGQKMPAAMVSNGRIAIEGNRFVSSGMGAVYEGTLELDASTTPRRLDMKFDKGPETGNTNPGIYQLDSDRWTICVATRDTVRPSTFTSTPGSGIAVEVLTRGSKK
jgi:uncharacterized protein (TIGR03067 family)